MSFVGNSTKLTENPHSWTKLGNVLYVDQPAGTGFSTASHPNRVRHNERVTTDFIRWLKNFFAYFPHMQSKQVHLIGESYAGIYVPYFASAIVGNNDSLPLDLRSVSIGDGTWGNAAAMTAVTTGAYLRSKQSELQIPDDILSVFEETDQICGFDQVLKEAQTYPPDGKIVIPGNPEGINYKRANVPQHHRNLISALANCGYHPTTANETRQSILNSTCEGPCATFSTAYDYLATAFEIRTGQNCFSIYDITDNCSTINPDPLISSYFSRADVQEALHIPQSSPDNSDTPVKFVPCNSTILNTLLGQTPPPEPPAYSILPDLTSFHNVHLHIYSGENDLLINHFGSELAIQNLTWRGTQGWSHKPDQNFYVNDAAPRNNPWSWSWCTLNSPYCTAEDGHVSPVAGVWGEGRSTTYHLFYDAGHSVFVKQPGAMFAYVRDVVVSSL